MTVSRRKIAVVTSSRADYAHVRWLLHELSRNPKIELQVIALGPHLSPLFGDSERQRRPWIVHSSKLPGHQHSEDRVDKN